MVPATPCSEAPSVSSEKRSESASSQPNASRRRLERPTSEPSNARLKVEPRRTRPRPRWPPERRPPSRPLRARSTGASVTIACSRLPRSSKGRHWGRGGGPGRAPGTSRRSRGLALCSSSWSWPRRRCDLGEGAGRARAALDQVLRDGARVVGGRPPGKVDLGRARGGRGERFRRARRCHVGRGGGRRSRGVRVGAEVVGRVLGAHAVRVIGRGIESMLDIVEYGVAISAKFEQPRPRSARCGRW